MSFWSNLQLHKWLNAASLLVYVVSLIILIVNRKKISEKGKMFLLFSLFAIPVFYSDFLAKLLVDRVLPSFMEYERFSWLFFACPIIAFACMSLDLKGKKVKSLIVCVIVFSILVTSGSITKGFLRPDNVYKVPNEVIEISDVIADDAGCYQKTWIGMKRVAKDESGQYIKPKVFVQVEKEVGQVGDPLYYGIRQYSSALILGYALIDQVTLDNTEFDLEDYGIFNYQYLVLSKDDKIIQNAEKHGFVLLETTKNHSILKNDIDVTLYLVRHGQTEANVTGICVGGGSDSPLTEEGKEMVGRTAEALSNVNFTTAYSSELGRAINTANIILDKNKLESHSLKKDSRFNDLNWGELEGKSWGDISLEIPGFSIDESTGDKYDASFQPEYEIESKYSFVNRFDDGVLNIIKLNHGSVLLVTHSAAAWWLQTKFPEIEISSIDNASITVVKYDKGVWKLVTLNAHAEEFSE